MSFSIKQLLLSVVFVALGLMALMNAGRHFMAEAVQLFNFVILAFVAYGIWLTNGERRAFRIGYVAWFAVWTIAPYHNRISQAMVEQVAPLFFPKSGVNARSDNPFSDNSAMGTVVTPTVRLVPADSNGDSVTVRPASALTQTLSNTAESGQPQSSSGFDDLFPSTTAAQQATSQTGSGGMSYYEWHSNFESIFNGLFTMLLGFVGGWITVLVYRKRQRMLQMQMS